MYTIKKVKGDGACLFYAVSYGILKRINKKIPNNDEYRRLGKQLRKLVSDILKKNIDDNIDYDLIVSMAGHYQHLKNNENNNLSIRNDAYKYVKWIRKECNFGGDIELKILTSIVQEKFNIKGINVYNADELPKFTKIRAYSQKQNITKKRKPINIILYDVKNGGIHFDYIEKTENTSIRK